MRKGLLLFIGLVIGLFMVGMAGVASAAIIYEQRYNPDDQDAHFADDTFYKLYDNFQLSENTQVSGASIWGVYWNNGEVPVPTTFELSFYTDINWDNPRYSLTLNATSVIDTGYDHNGKDGANIIEITFDFSSLLAFNAGQEYWFGAQAINPLANKFAWQNSFAVDNLYYQNNNQIANSADIAFNLHAATPVPVPATMLLFCSGLVGIAGTRLRKK